MFAPVPEYNRHPKNVPLNTVGVIACPDANLFCDCPKSTNIVPTAVFVKVAMALIKEKDTLYLQSSAIGRRAAYLAVPHGAVSYKRRQRDEADRPRFLTKAEYRMHRRLKLWISGVFKE